MNLLELISRRRSVRHYAARAVEEEKIDYLPACVRLAPAPKLRKSAEETCKTL